MANLRKLGCEVCRQKLLSVYVRDKKLFKSLEGYYYCKTCDKIYRLNSNNVVTE